jgi:phage terminase large subunit
MGKLQNLPPDFNLQIDPEVFNAKYYPELETIHEYEVYYGGQGSGKSWFVCQKKTLQLTTMPGRNMICLRKQNTDCYDSCWGQICTAIKQMKLDRFWLIKESEHRMKNLLNGNQIYFDGVDKIENIKSFKPENGNLTDVWYEEATEELDIAVFRIIDGRLRDENIKTSLILSFNPVFRTHPLRNFIEVEIKGLDALIMHSTHWDNKFLSKSYHEKTERLKYTDPYRYQVYGLGEWGVTGQTVFNANLVSTRLMTLIQKHAETPPMRIEFAFERNDEGTPQIETFRPFKYADGETWIYVPPNPKHPYVLSVDTAGEGDDWFAGHVIDNITGEQVAVFHSERMPEVCVLQLFGLARYYNKALLVPETNFDGSFLVNKFKEFKYFKIYQRSKPADSYNEGVEAKLGFRTTSETRPLMLQYLVEWTGEHMNCINDVATLNEMLTFTRQAKKTKGIWWGAEAGAHDDLVMSLAIALQGREQQEYEEIPPYRELKGVWFPEELDMCVRDGELSREDVLIYKKKHRLFGDKYAVKKRRVGNGY